MHVYNTIACMQTIKYGLPCCLIHLRELSALCNKGDNQINEFLWMMKINIQVIDDLRERVKK